MRRDCRHYHRRTVRDGETVEACALDAAPDAPVSCPEDCPWFERRTLDTVGFTYGSLGPDVDTGEDPLDGPEAAGVLDELRDLVEGVSDDVVADEAEQRAARERARKRARRRRRK